jgi:hypothetical protein
VLARPASESPELLELVDDPELPLELFELPEPELPQAASVTAQAAVISAIRTAATGLRVIFCISTRPPAYLWSGHANPAIDRRQPPSLLPIRAEYRTAP